MVKGRIKWPFASLSNLKSLFYVPLYVSYKRNEAPSFRSPALPHVRVVRSEEDKFHLQRIMRSDLQRIMRSDPGIIQQLQAETEDDTDSAVDKGRLYLIYLGKRIFDYDFEVIM